MSSLPLSIWPRRAVHKVLPMVDREVIRAVIMVAVLVWRQGWAVS
jgi:hypothetical protein